LPSYQHLPQNTYSFTELLFWFEVVLAASGASDLGV
jgi:hypothetical protein